MENSSVNDCYIAFNITVYFSQTIMNREVTLNYFAIRYNHLVFFNDDPVQLLTVSPEEAKTAVHAGTVDAVVAASPSAARRIAQLFPTLRTCRFIAIGRPTAAEAGRLGITVAAIAKEPTPDGIVAALESVFANEGNLP